jgi:predicted nucleotidyltransferase
MSGVRVTIDTSLKAQLATIFEGRKVVFAYLFGSQTKGEAGPLSDIDIAICFDEAVAWDERFDSRLEVLGDLTDLFRTDDIDLVVLNDAPPLLAHRILREGLLLFCANEKTRVAFETSAVLKYLDWKPYIEKYTREVFGSGDRRAQYETPEVQMRARLP